MPAEAAVLSGLLLLVLVPARFSEEELLPLLFPGSDAGVPDELLFVFTGGSLAWAGDCSVTGVGDELLLLPGVAVLSPLFAAGFCCVPVEMTVLSPEGWPDGCF